LKINELLVSCVNISEDGYDYRGTFILSCCETEVSDTVPMEIDLAEFESDCALLEKIRIHFRIESPVADIKKVIMKKVMIHSGLSSKHVQGEYFNQEPDESPAYSSLDKA